MIDILVNFRVPKDVLNEFDGTCALAGLSRTQMLRQLIRNHILAMGTSLPDQIAESKRATNAIKFALRKAKQRQQSNPTSGSSKRTQTPLKPFSSLLYGK